MNAPASTAALLDALGGVDTDVLVHPDALDCFASWVMDRRAFTDVVRAAHHHGIPLDPPGEGSTFMDLLVEASVDAGTVVDPNVDDFAGDERFNEGTCPWWAFVWKAEDSEWALLPPAGR